MATWAWLVPQAELGAATRPSDAVLAQLPAGDAGKLPGDSVTWQGKTLYIYQDVTGTKADAQNLNPAGGNALTAGLGVANPLAPFSDVAHALTAFYDVVTNGKMWRSLGWLLLGLAVMLAGIILWIGPSAARRSPIGLAAEALG